MSRNIDIVAVGLILLGFAVFTQARNAFRFEVTSHRAVFFHQPHGPVVVIPDAPPAPHVPPIPFTRD